MGDAQHQAAIALALTEAALLMVRDILGLQDEDEEE